MREPIIEFESDRGVKNLEEEEQDSTLSLLGAQDLEAANMPRTRKVAPPRKETTRVQRKPQETRVLRKSTRVLRKRKTVRYF